MEVRQWYGRRKREKSRIIAVLQMDYLRAMSEIRRKDRIRNKRIRELVGIHKEVAKIMSMMRWSHHTKRTNESKM